MGFLKGAGSINSGEGPYANIVRNYTATQFKIRSGQDIDQDDLNNASNQIAANLINDILINGFSDIQRIGGIDASPVASTLFNGNVSPWAGTVFFSALNYDQYFRDLVLTLDSTDEKKEKGTYDLIAAAQAIQDIASVWNVTPATLWTFFSNLIQ